MHYLLYHLLPAVVEMGKCIREDRMKIIFIIIDVPLSHLLPAVNYINYFNVIEGKNEHSSGSRHAILM